MAVMFYLGQKCSNWCKLTQFFFFRWVRRVTKSNSPSHDRFAESAACLLGLASADSSQILTSAVLVALKCSWRIIRLVVQMPLGEWPCSWGALQESTWTEPVYKLLGLISGFILTVTSQPLCTTSLVMCMYREENRLQDNRMKQNVWWDLTHLALASSVASCKLGLFNILRSLQLHPCSRYCSAVSWAESEPAKMAAAAPADFIPALWKPLGDVMAAASAVFTVNYETNRCEESRSVFQKCFFPQSVSSECDGSNRSPRHTYSVTQNTEWPVTSLGTGKLNYFNLIPVVQTSLKGVKFGSFSEIILRGKKASSKQTAEQLAASDSYLSKNTRVQCVIRNSRRERKIIFRLYSNKHMKQLLSYSGRSIYSDGPALHTHTHTHTHTRSHTRDSVSCSEVLLQSSSDSRLSADGCDLICLRLPAAQCSSAQHYCFVWKSWLLLLRWWSREQCLRVSAEINMFMFVLRLCWTSFRHKKPLLLLCSA